MKKYYNIKVLFVFILLLIAAFSLDGILKNVGYQGYLYSPTIYNIWTAVESYSPSSPRTGVFMLIGTVMIYTSLTLRKIEHFKSQPVFKIVFNTDLVIGIIIAGLGCLDAVNAIIYMSTL